MRYPGFIHGSYPSQSPIADGEVTRNFYPEIMESRGAKNRIVLYPTPGQTAWATVSEIGTRALFTMGSRTHTVVGSSVKELLATHTATSRGTVLQDQHVAQITSNGAVGNQLLIASGGTTSYLDLTTNVVTATGVSALQIGAIDGQGLALDPTSAKVFFSNLDDFSTWDPNLFIQRSTAPDPWQALITADRTGTRLVWLIGEQTGDVYYPTGDADNPFAPIQGSLFKYGTPAPSSVAAAGAEVIWLSQSAEGAGIVVAATGYTPQRISTHAVETAIAGYARTSLITDAEAFTYQDQGHTFYVLTFPAANATWVCDRTTTLWAQRGTWNAALSRYDAWHPRVHTYAFGQHLVGESGTGQISSLSVTVGTEADGSYIRRQRIAPAVFRERRKFLVRRFELYLESGLGLATGQGSDPAVMLRVSNDGGKTFGNELHASAGKIGRYDKCVCWTRLGLLEDGVFEVTVSDPVPFRLVDAFINNDQAA